MQVCSHYKTTQSTWNQSVLAWTQKVTSTPKWISVPRAVDAVILGASVSTTNLRGDEVAAASKPAFYAQLIHRWLTWIVSVCIMQTYERTLAFELLFNALSTRWSECRQNVTCKGSRRWGRGALLCCVCFWVCWDVRWTRSSQDTRALRSGASPAMILF